MSKDLDIEIGYEARLQGSRGGNIVVVTGEGKWQAKVTIQRADIESLVLGVFEFLKPDEASELMWKLKSRPIK